MAGSDAGSYRGSDAGGYRHDDDANVFACSHADEANPALRCEIENRQYLREADDGAEHSCYRSDAYTP